MKNCTFKVGTVIEIGGQRFSILRFFENGSVQLESERDGMFSLSTHDDLLRQYTEGKLSFSTQSSVSSAEVELIHLRLGRPLSTFPEHVQDKAIRKKKYLDFILQNGPFTSTPNILKSLIDECARQINDPNPPSPVSLYRWYLRLIRAKWDHRALIDRTDLRGGSGCRLHSEVQKLLQESIDQVYLAPERNSACEVHSDLESRISYANEFRKDDEKLSVPSKSTVHRLIRKLDKYDVTAARFGDHIARMRFRTSGRGPQPQRILQRVEIDHTPLDLFVIDEKTYLPMGRPTITLATDKFSKMPVGIHIGFDGPSIEAVFACLRHAILPKTDLRTQYPDIKNDWPCYGTIEELVCDNGLEFHSKELERVALEIGTILTFCPKRQPFYKGSVERFLKTINFQFAHALPGTSFSKWFHREDYDSQKHAVIPFNQLRSLLYRWLIDVYSQQLHRGIGTTPYLKWMEGLKQFAPGLPVSSHRLDIVLGRSCVRKLSHSGIELFNLRYNAPELLSIRRQLGDRHNVDVIYYAGDISYVNVIDPITKEAIPVPALEKEYTHGITLEQHRLICAHIRKVQQQNVNTVELARAKAEIRASVREMAFSKSQKKRQRAARLISPTAKQFDSSDVSGVTPKSQTTNIENLSEDVKSVDLPNMKSFILGQQPESPTF